MYCNYYSTCILYAHLYFVCRLPTYFLAPSENLYLGNVYKILWKPEYIILSSKWNTIIEMKGNIYSANLTENTSYLNNLGGTESHDEEDPRILVSSYMMYKLGKYTFIPGRVQINRVFPHFGFKIRWTHLISWISPMLHVRCVWWAYLPTEISVGLSTLLFKRTEIIVKSI